MEPIRPEQVRFTVDLEIDLHRQLRTLALQERCSASEVARYAIRKVIQERLQH